MASILFEIIIKTRWNRYFGFYEAIVPFSSCHAKRQVLSFKYGCWKVLYRVCLIAVAVKQGMFAGTREITFRKIKMKVCLNSFLFCHYFLFCNVSFNLLLWSFGERTAWERCFMFSTARKSPWGIYLRHLKINTRLIPVSKLAWNRTFALFDKYCETDMFLPATFNESHKLSSKYFNSLQIVRLFMAVSH